jgi:hypothetical protein
VAKHKLFGAKALTVGVLALACFTLPLSAMALTATVDPLGYHPKAHKSVVLTDLPAGLKIPAGAQLVDPAHVDPLFLKPKVVYKTTLMLGQAANANAWVANLDAAELPGTYQLRVGNQLAPANITISPARYWQPIAPMLLQLQGLQSPPPQAGELACENEAEYVAHSNLGWRTDTRAREKLTQANAMAVLTMLHWYGVNPSIQRSLKINASSVSDGQNLLDINAQTLRWLMDLMVTTGPNAGARKGLDWPQPGRCYTLKAIDTKATLTTIAALAKAAQVYKKTDLGFAVKCLMAAEEAWQQLPKSLPPQLAPWMGLAAGELWLATEKPFYENAFWLSVQHSPNTTFNNTLNPLPLVVADVIKIGGKQQIAALSPDRISWLSQWLATPLPDLSTVEGLVHHTLLAYCNASEPALQQVAGHLPTLTKANNGLTLDKTSATKLASINLLTHVDTLWVNGMLNELFNTLPATADKEGEVAELDMPQTEPATDMAPSTAGQMLEQWAKKRQKNTAKR